jgi:hypothetical protein
MQMVHLGAQVAVPSPDATALSDRIRAICRDIAHRTQAVEETERLIGS